MNNCHNSTTDPFTVLEIKWPLGEAAWLDFHGGDGLLADECFMRRWLGVDDPDYLALMKDSGQFWSEIQLDGTQAWLIGDVPGLLAPSTGKWKGGVSRSDAPVLGIWKWLSAPEDFDIPLNVTFSQDQLGNIEWFGRISTSEGDYKFFSSIDDGQEVLQRKDVPVLGFAAGTSDVQVRTVELVGPAGVARFHLYLIWGAFVDCHWCPESPQDCSG